MTRIAFLYSLTNRKKLLLPQTLALQFHVEWTYGEAEPDGTTPIATAGIWQPWAELLRRGSGGAARTRKLSQTPSGSVAWISYKSVLKWGYLFRKGGCSRGEAEARPPPAARAAAAGGEGAVRGWGPPAEPPCAVVSADISSCGTLHNVQPKVYFQFSVCACTAEYGSAQ